MSFPDNLLFGTLFVAVVGLGVATLLPLLGRRYWILDLCVHFRPHLAAANLLLALLSAGLGHPLLVLCAGLLAALNAAYLLMAYCRAAVVAGVPATSGLDLVALNVQFANPDHERVLDFLRRKRADLVILVEVVPELERCLDRLADLYPHRASAIETPLTGRQARWCGLVIMSREPLLDRQVVYPGSLPGRPALACRIAHAGRPVTIVAAHSAAPQSGETSRARDLYLRELGKMTKILANQSAAPVVVGGDLNTTPWARSYGDLVKGGGLSGPIPGPSFPAILGWIGIPIDHVLASAGARVVRSRIGPAIGSDHRPVLATIALCASKL